MVVMDDADEGGQDFRARAQAELAASNAAIKAVEKSMSGQPVQDIEVRLIDELRARNVFMGRDEVHIQALRISDPELATRDPRSVEKPFTDLHSPESAQGEAEFVAQVDRTHDRLGKIVDSMWRVRRATVSSHRTMDGMTFEVRIDPWSR